MATYTIARCDGKPDWTKIPTLKMETEYRHAEHTVEAWAQLSYDDDALYVRLQAVEPHIRAEHTGLLDEICEDSCLEFFFCPMEGDDRYFNLEVNPNCAMYVGFGRSIPTLQRLIPEVQVIKPQATRTEDGWFVEYAIPHELVQLFFPAYKPASGKVIKANCYKCSELSATPHWLCWSPVPEERGTFHCPELFGIMRFA